MMTGLILLAAAFVSTGAELCCFEGRHRSGEIVFPDLGHKYVLRDGGEWRVNNEIFLRDALKGRSGFEVRIFSPPEAVYPTGSIHGQTRAGVPESERVGLRVHLEN
ncbi:MAG: hypothetical protein FJW38_11380 [Acidobacteria bacterium]|nr:hypothetical protein [Acidobacteriota bacterium]